MTSWTSVQAVQASEDWLCTAHTAFALGGACGKRCIRPTARTRHDRTAHQGGGVCFAILVPLREADTESNGQANHYHALRQQWSPASPGPCNRPCRACQVRNLTATAITATANGCIRTCTLGSTTAVVDLVVLTRLESRRRPRGWSMDGRCTRPEAVKYVQLQERSSFFARKFL